MTPTPIATTALACASTGPSDEARSRPLAEIGAGCFFPPFSSWIARWPPLRSLGAAVLLGTAGGARRISRITRTSSQPLTVRPIPPFSYRSSTFLNLQTLQERLSRWSMQSWESMRAKTLVAGHGFPGSHGPAYRGDHSPVRLTKSKATRQSRGEVQNAQHVAQRLLIQATQSLTDAPRIATAFTLP